MVKSLLGILVAMALFFLFACGDSNSISQEEDSLNDSAQTPSIVNESAYGTHKQSPAVIYMDEESLGQLTNEQKQELISVLKVQLDMLEASLEYVEEETRASVYEEIKEVQDYLDKLKY